MKTIKIILSSAVLLTLCLFFLNFQKINKDEKNMASMIQTEDMACFSNGDPLATCTCPLPSGACAYVRPTATCYNGTSPLCP